MTADHVGGEYGVERACRFAFPDGGVCGLHPPQRKNVTVLPTTMMLSFAAAVMFTSPEEQVFSRVTAAVGKLNAWMQARMRGLVATWTRRRNRGSLTARPCGSRRRGATRR